MKSDSIPGSQSEEGPEGVDEDGTADVEDAEEGVADVAVHHEQAGLHQGKHEELERVVLA